MKRLLLFSIIMNILPFTVWSHTYNLYDFIQNQVKELMNSNDDGWKLAAITTDGDTIEIAMEEVGSLVAVDDGYIFSVHNKSGNIIKENVIKIFFIGGNTTDIQKIEHTGNIISKKVSNKLVLMLVKGVVSIFNSSGVLQIQTTAQGSETTIDVSNLPPGLYIVKAGKQVFKFTKN